MIGLLIWVLPVLVFVLFAIRQRSDKQISIDSTTRALTIHKERLADLLTQKNTGTLSETEYQSFKLEEEKAMLADFHISITAVLTTLGKPWPPYSGSQASAVQPDSANCV